MKFLKFAFLGVLSLNLWGEELDFDSLDISGSEVKSEDKPFITPGAVSVRESVGESTQSIDSIIRSVPGAFTQIDQAQAGVSVNIRGMTGPGRVATMIDGVTQNFYGTAGDDGWHSNIGTSSFTAPVDKSFLVGVDFERGTFSSGGGNALMGSANFRTMGVSDIVRDGANMGLLMRYSYGSNAVGPAFMLGVAGREILEDGSKIGFLFANSGQNISQDYKIGGGGKVGEQYPDFDYDDDGINDSYLDASINPQRLRHEPRSRLFKAEWEKDIYAAVFQYRDYRTNLSGREIENETYQFNGRINDPTKSYLDLNFLFAYTHSAQTYNQGETWAMHDVSGVRTKNRAVTMDLNNAYFKAFGEDAFVNLTYGVNVLDNRYSNDFPAENLLLPYIFTSFYPQGKQEIRTLYFDLDAKKSIFDINANVNFVDANIYGHKGVCAPYNALCEPKEATFIDKTWTSLNFSLLISANLHSLFTPFASISRTHRIPNVQEFFFTHDQGFSYGDFSDPQNVAHNMNTFLEPEQADTYQAGFNSFYHGLFADDDTFGFKALYYYTRVKNYIYNRWYYHNTQDEYESDSFLRQINDDSAAYFWGVELEFKYDVGFFYSFLSYTYQYSRHKYSDSETIESVPNGTSGQAQFAKLPEHYANLDLGTRLFSEKFTLGALFKFTGKTKRITPENSDSDPNDQNTLTALKTDDTIPQIPTIVDLYASFRPIKQLNFKLEVQNLLDENYMDALYTYNSNGNTQNVGGVLNPVFIYNNSARGRTFIASFEFRY